MATYDNSAGRFTCIIRGIFSKRKIQFTVALPALPYHTYPYRFIIDFW